MTPLSSSPLVTLPPPVQPKEAAVPPRGEDWSYELFWGGERVRAVKDGGSVRLHARDGRLLSNRFPAVAAAVARLRSERAVIDGEILQIGGYSPEAAEYLANASDELVHARVVLIAYDLLQLGEHDLRERPLLGRRVLLASLLQGTPIVLSPLIAGSAEVALRAAAHLGLRGIVAKRAVSSYRPNALSAPWLKVMLPQAT